MPFLRLILEFVISLSLASHKNVTSHEKLALRVRELENDFKSDSDRKMHKESTAESKSEQNSARYSASKLRNTQSTLSTKNILKRNI